MKQENFLQAERLLRIRKEIEMNIFHTYTADDNHHGSNVKESCKSKPLAEAHEHLRKAFDCIGLELQEL